MDWDEEEGILKNLVSDEEEMKKVNYDSELPSLHAWATGEFSKNSKSEGLPLFRD